MINKNRLLDTFLKIVQIDSPSGYEKAMVTYVISYLKSIGIVSKVDSYGNIIAKYNGDLSIEALLLSAHLDTVEPGRGVVPIIKDEII